MTGSIRPRGARAGLALAALGFGSLIPTAQARAQVFTEAAQARLCDAETVKIGPLALAIINQAQAGLVATTANARGSSPNDLTEDEALYALRIISAAPTEADGEPFGPGVLSTSKEAVDARGRVSTVVTDELSALMINGPVVAGKVRYRFVPGPGAERVAADRIFDPAVGHSIRCEVVATPGVGSERDGGNSGGRTTGLRIRGSVADLAIGSTDPSALDPASVGLDIDEIKGTSSATLDLVVGVPLLDPASNWNVIPFVSYEIDDQSGGGDDVDKFSPGVLLSHRLEQPDFSLISRAEASYLIDREQSSEQIKARVYFDPAFRLWGPPTPDPFDRTSGILFGNWFTGSSVSLRPDLTLIGDFTEVRDPGSNAALIDGSYIGLGGEATLRLRWNALPDLGLRVGVRQLWLSGDITLDEATRVYGELEWAVKASPVGVAISVSQGENDDTFQAEDKIEMKLTYRR